MFVALRWCCFDRGKEHKHAHFCAFKVETHRCAAGGWAKHLQERSGKGNNNSNKEKGSSGKGKTRMDMIGRGERVKE